MTSWVKTKEVREYSGTIDQALDRLEQAGSTNMPGFFVGPLASHHHIYKLRLGGKVRLRPLLCKGPIEPSRELTFLVPAFERNWDFDPPDAPARAEQRRQVILFDRNRWRHYGRPKGYLSSEGRT